MPDTECDVEVAIVGAGPTGLALAGELALAGISCQVLERRAEEPNVTRAFAVHARTLELLDGRGLADDLLPRGSRVDSVQPTPGATLDLSILDSKYPMVLIVAQSGTERLLADRAAELGVKVARGTKVVGLAQDDERVQLVVEDGAGQRTLTARYVVGTDGAHSTVRRLVGVDFVGEQYQTHILLADVQLSRAPVETLFGRNNADGLVLVVPFGDGWYRAIVWDRRREQAPLDEPVTLAELTDAFTRIAGDDLGMGEPRWRSRFLSERRQAARYRVGRVFLAGDAAHVHSPIGGQGMNTGIQDAMNLGWKLAAALHGWAGEQLLDSYQAERHPVGASVLAMTDRMSKLVLSSSRLGAVVRPAAIRTALLLGPVRHELADRVSGLGIHYATPGGGKWAGHRVPHHGEDGQRIYTALRTGRFLLVDRTAGTGDTDPETAAAISAALADWSDRVVPVAAAAERHAPALALVRPDGYVAWASNHADELDELRAALSTWCGPATGPGPVTVQED